MIDFIARWQIPGGALAVAKDGRLVFAHGYGWAALEGNVPVQPDSLFRIASISKPITAVAILKLVDEGLLDLDAKVFQILDDLWSPRGLFADSRFRIITVRHLLYHSGGWDRSASFDPMFSPVMIAAALDIPGPPDSEEIIRYMADQPLDFDPGRAYAYSNFGYNMLGRVIERISGQTYEEFVKGQILEPLGLARMQIGSSLLEGRKEGEVRYYGAPGQRLTSSVFPGAPPLVPMPYGGFYLEAMDSHGGWIASAIDLVRFVTAVDGSRQPPLLEPDTVEMMVAPPPEPLWQEAPHYYSMGWFVQPLGDSGANWWHAGNLPGTTALLVRAHHGLAWAALFNSLRYEPEFSMELDAMLWQASGEVEEWPSHDLFERYY